MQVTLTTSEMFRAAIVGVHRHLTVKEGRHRSPLLDGDAWGNNIEGACGECAFAKFAGVYWDGSVGTFTVGGDVAGLEVRTRRHPTYELIIRPHDHDDRGYVLMRGTAPTFAVVGWMRGEAAKQPAWLKTHGGGAPAYFVPDEALQPIETLLAELRRTHAA